MMLLTNGNVYTNRMQSQLTNMWNLSQNHLQRSSPSIIHLCLIRVHDITGLQRKPL